MNEIWKDIEGYEGIYQVSNLGRVKSLEAKLLVKNNHYRSKKESILSQYLCPNGYLAICLRLNKKTKRFLVHRLVGAAYIENPEGKLTINHKDGNKQNNLVCNLEWATHSENLAHALNTGLRRPKKKALSEFQALAAITIMSTRKRCGAAISREFGVSKSAIDRVRKRETWSHIPWPKIES